MNTDPLRPPETDEEPWDILDAAVVGTALVGCRARRRRPRAYWRPRAPRAALAAREERLVSEPLSAHGDWCEQTIRPTQHADSDSTFMHNSRCRDSRAASERPPVDPLREAAWKAVTWPTEANLDALSDVLRASEVASPAAPRPEGLEPWQVSVIHDAADRGIIGARAWLESLSDTGDIPEAVRSPERDADVIEQLDALGIGFRPPAGDETSSQHRPGCLCSVCYVKRP